MQRKTLLVSALALLLAGSASFVMAQDAPAPPPLGAKPALAMNKHAMGHHGERGGHDMGGRRGGEHGGVIGDLRGLEHLYIRAGRSRDLPGLYNEVLAKSQDPRVRDYVYQHLARAQMQPTNVDEAIATLRKGLDESLANEARMHAEMEKMRANWQQHRSEGPAPEPQPPLSR